MSAAGKRHPVHDLKKHAVKCGSGLAREEAVKFNITVD
jgi:hypothetical protein